MRAVGRLGCRATYILASYISAVTFDSRLTRINRSPFLRDGEFTLILINRHVPDSPTFVTEDRPLRPTHTGLETRGMPIGISLVESN